MAERSRTMKTLRCMRRPLIVSIVLPLLPQPGNAIRPTFTAGSALYMQESGAGAPLGKLNVPREKMAGRCLTMVSPNYPQTTEDSPKASTVIVRVVVWKSGNVSPMQVVSGQPSLQAEAMNTVRLWRYKPYTRDGEPLDVTTEIRVNFDPTKPGGMVTHPAH
jgi:TonB family protein